MISAINDDLVSAAIHGLAFLAVLPAGVELVRRGEPSVRGYLTAYVAGLLLCFGASTLCHAEAAVGSSSSLMVKFDHMAIYVLIAGTYTPIAGALLPVRRRRTALLVIWMAATLGIVLNAVRGPLPATVATGFYLAMGWGGLWCYAAVRPMLSHRDLRLVPMGGVIYSVGAIFHVTKSPVIWTGVVGPHELFHVLVVVAAIAHYRFIWIHGTARRPTPVRRPVGRKAPGRRYAAPIARV